MATYKEIKGVTVQTKDEDPVNKCRVLVKWWCFKYTRAEAGGAGIQTATLAFGGNTPSFTANTEQYNGTSWTEVEKI